MKKSIITRLIGGSLLLLLTIALLAVWFWMGVRVDRIIDADAAAFISVTEKVRLIGLRASMICADGTAEAVQGHVSEIRAAQAVMAPMVTARTNAPMERRVYDAALRASLTTLLTRLGSRWQSNLSRFTTVAEKSFDSPQGRDEFEAFAPSFLAETESLGNQIDAAIMGINEARRNALGSFVAIFVLLLGIGSLAVIAYTLLTLFPLRRDITRLLSMSRMISEGDFASLPPIQRADEIGELAGQLHKLSALQLLVSTLQASMQRLDEEHEKVSESVKRTVSSVRSQANALEEAGKGFEGIVRSVHLVEETASSGRDAAREGSGAVDTSLQAITRGMEATRTLEDRTARIEEVVSLIGDVADQTELLSLNAAIEAARAGEAGRGFTVVAQQVRKLADRSARAASEISDLVQAVHDGVRRIAGDSKESLDTGRVLQKELQKIAAVTASITELAHSASEIVSRADTTLDAALGVAMDTSRRVDELVASSRSMHEILAEIDKAIGRFAPAKNLGAPAPRQSAV